MAGRGAEVLNPVYARFQRIGLIGKPQVAGLATASAGPAVRGVAEFLNARGHEVLMDAACAAQGGVGRFESAPLSELGARCDLAVVVGGDGTMLAAARGLSRYRIPLVGINQGHLGFITDVALDDVEATLLPILQGHYVEETRSLMSAQVMRAGVCIFEAIAMNDVVVNRGGSAGLMEVRIGIDGHFVADQRADGLIVATPTGSTAYALSAGGSLLHPALNGWIVVPIAPHRLSNRPIVVSDTCTIEIELMAGKHSSANFDMQGLADLAVGDKVVVTKAAQSVRFLHPKGWNYFNTLRQKLHWNE